METFDTKKNEEKKCVRKKKNTKATTSKKKTCRSICNEEGHYAPECPNKEKSAKNMVNILEERELESYLVKSYVIWKKFYMRYTVKSEILYEIHSVKSSDKELVFTFKKRPLLIRI